MLVLSRKEQEAIKIDGGITVTVLGIEGGRVRIGIEAPDTTRILREELERIYTPVFDQHEPGLVTGYEEVSGGC